MDAAAQQAAVPTGSNLAIDKFVEGSITCLRFQGTIDEAFDGRRLAGSMRCSTLILDMGAVKKISSFGLREWADFIKTVERQVQQIIAIECTPKVVDQINMVSQFLGTKGQVFSFYAPYRCDYCDIDRRVLFQVDRDHAAIRSLRPPEQLCETCSRPEYFDEEPASFFSYIAAQQAFELSPEIVDFLSSKLRYALAGGDRRLHVDKQIEGRSTYLKFVGNLDGSFPSTKIAEGLEGIIVVDLSGVGTVDLAGAAEWRNFINMTKATAEKVYLVGCPPVMLQRLTRPGDLGDHLVSFTMPYSCAKCATTASQLIEVAEHFDILKFATPPEMKCTHCKSPTVCVAPEALLSRLRSLPNVEVDSALRKFIKEMRDRKPERAQPRKKAQVAGARLGMFSALIFIAVAAAGTLVVINWYQQGEAQDQLDKVEKAIADVKPSAGITQRPVWITSVTELSAYCTDYADRLACVGVSSFNGSRDAARLEAINAALEEMANTIGLKIGDKTFKDVVRPMFGSSRADALRALESTPATSEAYPKAVQAVRTARQAAAEALPLTGGSAAPVQQSDWYWEEYNRSDGQGTEFQVFVRFDLNPDGLRTLIQEYSTAVEVHGSKVVTLFPGLVWRYPDTKQGVVVLDAAGRLKSFGLEDKDLIVAVNGQPVRNSADLQSKLEKGDRTAILTVKGQDGKSRELRR
jgi:anti-anti-sigma regulatory factor/sulfur carrier protein ThiS